MKLYLKNLIFLTLVYAGLAIFLLSTNPNKLSVGLLIVPFVWLFAAVFLTVRLAMRLFVHRDGLHASRKQLTLAALVAVVPTLLLLLDSINQLTAKDGLLIVALGIGGLFYMTRLHLKKPIF